MYMLLSQIVRNGEIEAVYYPIPDVVRSTKNSSFIRGLRDVCAIHPSCKCSFAVNHSPESQPLINDEEKEERMRSCARSEHHTVFTLWCDL